MDTTISRNLARIMRAARKRGGLSQCDVARIMGTSQASISNYEGALSRPDAIEWLAFCAATGIHPGCPNSGFIDLGRPAGLQDCQRVGGFRIPERYVKNQGSKIRTLLPTLNFLSTAVGGPIRRDLFLKEKGFDPDFFTCIDEQLPITFFADVIKYLLVQGHLDDRTLTTLAGGARTPYMHGRFERGFNEDTAPVDLLGHLISNVRHYECNFRYEVADRSKRTIDILISPEEHVNVPPFRSDPVLGDFFCRYKKRYFEVIANFHNANRPSKIQLRESECIHKGAKRCAYRIEEVQ